MRLEDRLRQGRDWFFKNYFVDNLDDAMRMSYWEQACVLLNYGLLH
jgi:hypothetical protein